MIAHSTSTQGELGACAALSRPANAGNVIQLRTTIAVLGLPIYLALESGVDRRPNHVINSERSSRSWRRALFWTAVLFSGASTVIMSTTAMAYLLKSMIGIDLMQEHFPLHELFFD